MHHTGLNTMPPLDPVKKSLETLYLDYNNISVVPSVYFEGFECLVEVYLQFNYLHTFPDVTPLSRTLITLQLSHNKVQSIPHKFYTTMFLHMQLLRLESNHISEFDYDSISGWPELRNLYVGFNKITSLPDINNQHVNCSTMRRQECLFHLHPNPFHCNSRASSIVTQKVHYDDTIILNCYINLNDISRVRCASPPPLCDQLLLNLSKSIFSFLTH